MSSRAGRKARRLHRLFFGTHYDGSTRAERRRNARTAATATTIGPRPIIIHGRVLNRRTRRHPERGQQ